jgi:UDP-N-acetylmuramate dehydrogenase
VEASTTDQLVDAVRSCDESGTPVLLVAGGSNLVVADEGFPGTVLKIATQGVRVEQDACSGATVTVAAGEAWDALVAKAVDEGWVGVEALSGVPGSVGATPIQNVGAYGQEVAETIASVRCWDRRERTVRTIAAAECGFGYRTSRFKQDPTRHVVLTVTFQLRLGDLGAPVRYAELARALGVEPGERVPMAAVRETVLRLRSGKGMVLDAEDHDTWSAGSFFTNPFLSPEQARMLPDDAPRWEQPDGRVKTSAAWLIERSGFGKGYGNGRVSLSTKHTLALTNRGAASTADLVALAREIRAGVEEKFGVRLVNEPVMVGCSL